MRTIIARVALLAACVIAASAGAFSSSLLPAAETSVLAEKAAGSLGFVPEDVGFYTAMLRGREQLDIVLASNAWQKLKSLPAVKSAWRQLEAQWTTGPLATAAQLMTLPENEELLSVLGDMSSHEVFMYGDKQIGVALDILNEINNTSRLSTVTANMQLFSGKFDEDPSLTQKRALLDKLADNLDALRMPTLVMGFRVEDAVAAKRQVKRLEVTARLLLGQDPQLASRFERKKIGDGDYVTLSLDGEMIPWEQYDFEEIAAEPGQYDALLEKLKSMTLTISIGTFKNYVLIAFSDSTEHLASLGSDDLLARGGQLDPLNKVLDQRLTAITYISEDLMGRLQGRPQDADYVKEWAEDMLEASDVEEDVRKNVIKDVEDLVRDVKALIPQPGPLVGYSFLTPRGIESFTHDRSQNLSWDGSRRLDLLEHVGGAPLAAVVGRGKVSVDQYKVLVKWVQIGWGYVERFAVPKMNAENKAEFDTYLAAAKPLLARFNATTIEKLLPALADGQAGLIVDGQWSSKQWLQNSPPTSQAMALPELALVLGVSDAKLLKAAMTDYQAIADDAVAAVRDLKPAALPPDFKIPHPREKTTPDGETFAYPLPAEAGVDPQVVFNAGLNEHAAVLSLSLAHTGRLLKATPFKASGVLADVKQPLAHALAWDWAGSVDLAAPWIELGVARMGPLAVQSFHDAYFKAANPDDENAPENSDQAPPPIDIEAILPQVREGLGLLKTLRGITSSLRTDEATGSTIRHTELHFEDAP